MSQLTALKEKLPLDYGRSIPIIMAETFHAFRKEKRFYISIIYYIAFPLLLLLMSAGAPVINTGTGIAIYYAQLNTSLQVKALFLSFFPGQIFLVILSSDQVASEVENDTLSLVMGKPVYHSEMIIGKFMGLLSILAVLQVPTLLVVYYSNLARYKAEFPYALVSSLDEVIAMLFLVIAIQGMILALSLMISSIFDRSLYAILTGILGLFIVSSVSDGIAANPDAANYLSLSYYLDAILPVFFFNLEKLDSQPSVLALFLVILGTTAGFLTISVALIRRRELF
ncbi:MAG: ABC transporter permease [Candidatus Kariarchaeaceae archaeon]|jgi:ABC-type transport system involved in multi-copper enzyme maturation permease subunit